MKDLPTAPADDFASRGGAVRWICRDRELPLYSRPLIMGIVNVTPDSFSDGGDYLDAGRAVERALCLVEQGADIIDIGGESTRPGAAPVEDDLQILRIEPVIRRLGVVSDVTISIDTGRAKVARRAIEAGAHIVNDVTALSDEPSMLSLVSDTGAGLVLMHMQGVPASMQHAPEYDDVVREVGGFLAQKCEQALAGGVSAGQLMIDPGIGFGKNLQHNLSLLARLDGLAAGKWPVLLGVSRKRCLGEVAKQFSVESPIGDRPHRERLSAGLAVAAIAAWQGVAVIRTHDVAPTRDAVDCAMAIYRERGRE